MIPVLIAALLWFLNPQTALTTCPTLMLQIPSWEIRGDALRFCVKISENDYVWSVWDGWIILLSLVKAFQLLRKAGKLVSHPAVTIGQSNFQHRLLQHLQKAVNSQCYLVSSQPRSSNWISSEPKYAWTEEFWSNKKKNGAQSQCWSLIPPLLLLCGHHLPGPLCPRPSDLHASTGPHTTNSKQ